MTRDEYRAVLEKQFETVFKNKLLPVDAKTQMEWLRLRTAWLDGAVKVWDALKCESLIDLTARTQALGVAAAGISIEELLAATTLQQFDTIVRAAAWGLLGLELTAEEREAQALFSDSMVARVNSMLSMKRQELMDLEQP